MKTSLLRSAIGLALLASGVAGAQTYSGYPTYGYSNTTGLVRCESIDSRSNFCRVDTRGGVQIYRQLSRENCVRGRNWDVRYDGIYVDDGCRAEFAVGTAYQARTGTVIGTDRYGRPIYSTTTSGGYDAYGRPIYSGTYGNDGYAIDRYGRRVYVGNSGYSNGGYAIDRYGNRVYVGTGGVYDDGYTYDQYGRRVYVGTSTYGSSGGYYTTDRYGNRVWVQSRGYDNSGYGSGGYYTTDRYGNRVWVEQSGYGRVYDDDYDTADQVYDNNQALGYPGTVTTYPQVITGGTTTSSSTYATGAIHCVPAATGRTYCGDKTRTYTMKYDMGSSCALNRTYGRDSGGFWVSAGCSMTLEPGKY